jgi:hypothetical protein
MTSVICVPGPLLDQSILPDIFARVWTSSETSLLHIANVCGRQILKRSHSLARYVASHSNDLMSKLRISESARPDLSMM